jgi:hypothetical protein
MNKLTPGIECLSFEYHKDNGDVSQREVVKFDIQSSGNFLCVDLTGIEDPEVTRDVAEVLSQAKREYLDAVYHGLKFLELGVKTFSPSKMKNVKNTTAVVFRDVKSVS